MKLRVGLNGGGEAGSAEGCVVPPTSVDVTDPLGSFSWVDMAVVVWEDTMKREGRGE